MIGAFVFLGVSLLVFIIASLVFGFKRSRRRGTCSHGFYQAEFKGFVQAPPRNGLSPMSESIVDEVKGTYDHEGPQNRMNDDRIWKASDEDATDSGGHTSEITSKAYQDTSSYEKQ